MFVLYLGIPTTLAISKIKNKLWKNSKHMNIWSICLVGSYLTSCLFDFTTMWTRKFTLCATRTESICICHAVTVSQSSPRRSCKELGCTLPSAQVCSDQRWQLSSAGDWLRGEQLSAVTDKKDAEETKNAQSEWQQSIEADGERIVSLDMDGEWVGEQKVISASCY